MYFSNTSHKYYLHNWKKGTHTLIGDYAHFIDHIAWHLLYEVNGIYSMDMRNVSFNGKDRSPDPYGFEDRYILKAISFMDENGHIVNPKNYMQDAINWKISGNSLGKEGKVNYWRQYSCGHSTNYCKGRFPKGHHAMKRQESAFRDEEYKEYSFKKHMYDHDGYLPYWLDETSRRVQGCWKYQYKVPFQHGIHTYQKDRKTIRKMAYCETYTADDVDLMLEEDFMNGVV